MAYLLDSSVWVALFLDFDTQHRKAERLLPKLKGTLYAPYCVVSEVVTILAYKHSKEQADNFLAFIENNRDVALVDDRLAEEIAFYKSVSAQISFADAALLFLSKRLKANLVTFDRQMERMSRKT